MDWQLWGDFEKLLFALDEHFEDVFVEKSTIKLRHRMVSVAHLMLNVSLMEAMTSVKRCFL